jgi:hypothetical protein
MLFLFSFLPSVCFSASTAQNVSPEQSLNTDQLVGFWQLEGTAHKLDGAKNPEDQSWEFRTDGMLKSIVEDRRADGTISLTVKYKIENNMLLIERIGSSRRWKRFQVVELTDSKMLLKGGIEGYMFFKRK